MSPKITLPLSTQSDDVYLRYKLIRSSRKTLAVYVYPNGDITVRAPKSCSNCDVNAYIKSREQWIVKSLTQFAKLPGQLKLQFEDGEAHAFLGELYALKLSVGEKRSLNVKSKTFHLNILQGDGPSHAKATFIRWYRLQAAILFKERLAFCFNAFSDANIPLPRLKIRIMKARWGSCSSRGDITLNLELIKHPIHVIDYVITHELCHLIEFNHSPRFYELMSQAIPTWEKSKDDLEKGVFLYGAFSI